jgi:beta-phosphoglucomutase-like phosphatase (HAD superfamily)
MQTKAILFDLDGVILDSEKEYTQRSRRTCWTRRDFWGN